MQTKKNELTGAELTKYYNLYEGQLTVKTSEHASRLFLEFARSINSTDGWYVIFLGKKKNFLCWQNLQNFCETDLIANDITSFAKSIGSKHIYMARLDSGRNCSLCYIDICWIASLHAFLLERNIKLDDYLIVSEQKWCSYRDDNFREQYL